VTLALVALFIVGYFGVGRCVDPSRARTLFTPLDIRIPFVPASVWVYLYVFPAALVPLFVVRCERLFRRTMLAYACVIVTSLACFAAFPVTSLGLRVDAATLDVSRFTPWAVATLYALDPPFNLFPSLHLSIATLAACSAWKARSSYGAAAFLGAALVGISICTVKQHFVADGIGGVALALLAHTLILRTYRPEAGTLSAYSWRGPAAFVALLAAVYAGFFVAFLSAA
jgi:membrane-associated phospholipid phosphatase